LQAQSAIGFLTGSAPNGRAWSWESPAEDVEPARSRALGSKCIFGLRRSFDAESAERALDAIRCRRSRRNEEAPGVGPGLVHR
jgi:hypothetical protein